MFTVTFVISFVCIVYLLLVKIYELKTNRVTSMTRRLSGYDKKVMAHWEELMKHFTHHKDRAKTLVDTGIRTKSKELTTLVKGATRDAYKLIIPDVRGKRVFKSDKQASEFLKNISYHKEQNGHGSIEG